MTRSEAESAILAKLHDYDSLHTAAREAFRLCPDYGSVESARSSLRRAKARIVRAARQGDSPAHDYTKTVPLGFSVSGVSSFYGRDGDLRGQWVKSRADEARQREIVEASYDALASDLPKLAPVQLLEQGNADLCNLFVVTDAHLGMMASRGEAGEQWGLEQGEGAIFGAFADLLHRAPRAGKAVIAQLGDFLHSDGLQPVTPTSRHPLDQGARFHDMVRAAVRLLRRLVDSALRTHSEVSLIIAEGNHDPASSVWLRVAFSALYEQEIRMTVIGGDLPYTAMTHGSTMLGFHHGHLRHPSSARGANGLALQFASMPEWGATNKRYIHVGHHHSESVTELQGVKIHAHPTLAAPDSYASRNFGAAHREMTAHTYSATHGRIATTTVVPGMI